MTSKRYVIIAEDNTIVGFNRSLSMINPETIAPFMSPHFEELYGCYKWTYNNISIGEFSNYEAPLEIELLIDVSYDWYKDKDPFVRTITTYCFFRIRQLIVD